MEIRQELLALLETYLLIFQHYFVAWPSDLRAKSYIECGLVKRISPKSIRENHILHIPFVTDIRTGGDFYFSRVASYKNKNLSNGETAEFIAVRVATLQENVLESVNSYFSRFYLSKLVFKWWSVHKNCAYVCVCVCIFGYVCVIVCVCKQLTIDK